MSPAILALIAELEPEGVALITLLVQYLHRKQTGAGPLPMPFPDAPGGTPVVGSAKTTTVTTTTP